MSRAAVWLLLVLLSGWDDDPDLYFKGSDEPPTVLVPRLRTPGQVEIHPNVLGGDTITEGFGPGTERTVCFPTNLGGWKCQRE